MNRYIGALLIIAECLSGCAKQSDKQSNQILTDKNIISEKKMCRQDTLHINVASSTIHWKGTKMRKSGKHEGTVSFENGFVLICNGKLSGGAFTVNMKSIDITDIPVTDPIPIKKLTDHLNNEDFFETKLFPVATLEMTNVEVTSDNFHVDGNLTIKEVTRPVSFVVTKRGNEYSATLTFNRFGWNIGYTGSWADRTLVDPEVELEIKLIMK